MFEAHIVPVHACWRLHGNRRRATKEARPRRRTTRRRLWTFLHRLRVNTHLSLCPKTIVSDTIRKLSVSFSQGLRRKRGLKKSGSKSSSWKTKKVTGGLGRSGLVSRRPFAQESSVYPPGLAAPLTTCRWKKVDQTFFNRTATDYLCLGHCSAFKTGRDRDALISHLSSRLHKSVVSDQVLLG